MWCSAGAPSSWPIWADEIFGKSLASMPITIMSIARPGCSTRTRPPGREHPPAPGTNVRVRRRDRLGGLIHEYTRVA
jgi:hypothetical protein